MLKKIISKFRAEPIAEAPSLRFIPSHVPAYKTTSVRLGSSTASARECEVVYAEVGREKVPSTSWIAYAYPLQQIAVFIQGNPESSRESMLNQLQTVLTRLKDGDDWGSVMDEQVRYAFTYKRKAPGLSLFQQSSGTGETAGVNAAGAVQRRPDDAPPLQQLTVLLQGTRHSKRDTIIGQLEGVLKILMAGGNSHEDHDDDFGYSFAYTSALPG